MKIKALVVCVDYSDLLAITAPRNVGYFSDFLVITTAKDKKTHRVCREVGIRWHETDAFTRWGATFNRGAALEEGFDVLGRDGWILVHDADILLPAEFGEVTNLIEGNIYGARRRMLPEFSPESPELLPPFRWDHLRPLREGGPFGYFQLFHASDPALKRKPWYPTTWNHAGGSDDEFREKWPRENKQWLPFDVLHIGENEQNWCGRITNYVDGTKPENADTNRKVFEQYRSGKKPTRNFKGK